jgi:hypothetical protein
MFADLGGHDAQNPKAAKRQAQSDREQAAASGVTPKKAGVKKIKKSDQDI